METIELSISTAFQEKHNKTGNKAAFGYNWHSGTPTLKQLIEWITDGKAICVAQVAGGHRIHTNFQQSQLIGIDIDEGKIRSVHDLLQIPFIAQYACFVGPTASSTSENPRSRVFFMLDTPIGDKETYVHYVVRLMDYLGSMGIEPDASCKDCVRMFFGSTQPSWHCNPTATLPISVIDTLPQKATAPKRGRIGKRAPKPRAVVTLSPDELTDLQRKIQTALAYIPKQQDYKLWLQVLMTVWDVLPNEEGVKLVEEWSPGFEGEVESKFASFDRNHKNPVTINSLWHMARRNGWHEDTAIKPDKVITVPYVSEIVDSIGQGVTILRSDMATGKTECVKQLIARLEKELRRSLRVLVISHRVSLIENQANRFGFESYASLNDKQLHQPDKLVITYNSLQRFLMESETLPVYHMVVMDECEQGFAHLTGGTFKGAEGVQAYNILCHFIRSAKHALAMDAHVGDLTYNTLTAIRQDIQYIVNTHKVRRGTLHVYKHEAGPLDKLLELLPNAQKTIAIASDEKAKVKQIEAMLRQNGYNDILAVHSDNRTIPEVCAFLADPNNELPKYRVLIYSPTIGTGVDIQADVDIVIAIFGGRTLKPEELHQMLVRCRKAKDFHVYIKARRSHLQTSKEAIYNKHYTNWRTTKGIIHKFDTSGRVELDDELREYLNLTCAVEVARNQSINGGWGRFLELAVGNYEKVDSEHNNHVVADEMRKIKTKMVEEEREGILTCPPIDDETYQSEILAGNASPQLEYGHKRFKIESYYGQTISMALLKFHDNGKGRQRIQLFVDIHRPKDALITFDYQQEVLWYALTQRTHSTQQWEAIHGCLPIIFGDTLHSDPIPVEDFDKRLAEFAVKYKAHEKVIYQVLNRRYPEQGEEKPLNILRYLLKSLGLKMGSLRERRDGKKVTVARYILPETLQQMYVYAQCFVDHRELAVDFITPLFKRL